MEEFSAFIKKRLTSLEEILTQIKNDSKFISSMKEACEKCVLCYERGGKLLICGNGGSAADAQHIAAELVNRFLIKNRRGLGAIALTTDSSILTSVANDDVYESVFSRQVEALGKEGDILLAISTSGESENIIRSAKSAHSLNMTVISFCGKQNSSLSLASDIAIITENNSTARIQEVNIFMAHVLCEYIEASLFS